MEGIEPRILSDSENHAAPASWRLVLFKPGEDMLGCLAINSAAQNSRAARIWHEHDIAAYLPDISPQEEVLHGKSRIGLRAVIAFARSTGYMHPRCRF